MTKTGRNDPCPCGSGKKFKNCCFKTKGGSGVRRKFSAKVISSGASKPQEEKIQEFVDKTPELMERTFGAMIGKDDKPPKPTEETKEQP